MYDTIHCYVITQQPINTGLFENWAHSEGSDGVRLSYHGFNDGIYVRYNPLSWTISVQFSVATVLNEPYGNITAAMMTECIRRVDEYLTRFSTLPSVRDWTITRIDYAYNFVVDDIKSYMLMLRELHHKYQRVQYDEDEGVLFSAKSRSIKFYNKAKQRGMGEAQTTLRYEVSNYPASVRYMAEHWFDCPRTVSEFIKPERAMYTLQRFWYELGLSSADAFTHHDAIIYKLRDAFGSSSLAAHTALNLIAQHGADAHKQQLLSRSQYYTWKRKLQQHSFLPHTPHTMPALRLPATDILSSAADNLKLFTSASLISLHKILPENEAMS